MQSYPACISRPAAIATHGNGRRQGQPASTQSITVKYSKPNRRRRSATSKYVVTFFKCVADSNGHLVDAPQAVIELSCSNLRDAIETATGRFAEARQIPNWNLHADRIAVSRKD